MSKAIVKVSALVTKVGAFLDRHVSLSNVQICGEISNLRSVRGHLYFDLKDENAQMACVMWASAASRIGFQPENGMEVLLDASLSIYKARGTLQLVVSALHLSGQGALYAILEERKRRLQEQGYFSPEHKKRKPDWIENIAIITGNNTAALKDVEKTIASRWPMLRRTLFPALVQGEKAPQEIIRQLKRADAMGFDAILLVRGGGSMEDLFCFNDEELVRTLYDLQTYVVTGVGHEIDYTLADYAADHRAVTPTAAAQWVTPDQNQVLETLRHQRQIIVDTGRRIFRQNAQQLMNLQSSPFLASPENWIVLRKNAFQSLDQALKGTLPAFISNASHREQTMKAQLYAGMQMFAQKQQQILYNSRSQLLLSSPAARIQAAESSVLFMSSQMSSHVESLLLAARQRAGYRQELLLRSSPKALIEKDAVRLHNLTQLLQAASPQTILDRGYAVVYQQGKQISSAVLASPADLEIRFKDGTVHAAVIQEN